MAHADDSDDVAFVENLYRVILRREPQEVEKQHWVNVLRGGLTDRGVFNRFWMSAEYQQKNAKNVVPGHPVGHYYSPVVDPNEARRYLRRDSVRDPEKIPGIAISMARMLAVWEALAPFLETSNFPFEQQPRCRYYALNGIYPIGDAAILRAMILRARPSRIIEIGSGFSSACMLDALDEADMHSTNLTFIEPDPGRLRSLLRPRDLERCTLVEAPVQAVDLGIFDTLKENDILFIDSSHVMKTGSDVNCELFDILPRLQQGVLIHFHDIQYPFEYPDEWIFNRRYSWNEIYAVRAFLMYNENFRIEFFTSLFVGRHRDLVSRTHEPILKGPGGSLWIRRIQA